MKKLFTCIFILSSLAVVAQPPNRNAPPPLGPASNLELPPIQRFTLSNGTNVVLMEKHNVPLVQINIMIETGSFDDPAGKEGLSSFTMDMLDEGAGTMDALQLADEIEFLGAEISTYSSGFTSGIACSTPASKIESAIKLMSDIALRPAFKESELERIRQLRLSGLLPNYDNPNIISQRALNLFLFDPALPYGKFPNETSIKSFSKDDLVGFHKTKFVSDNTTFIVVGDIGKDVLTRLLETHFGSYPKGTATNQQKPSPRQVKGRTVYIIDKPGAAQSVIRIGRIGTNRLDTEYNAINIMNTIFGDSFTSRLNTNLREEHGYSYGAGSRFSFWKIPGPFFAVSSVQTDVTGPALREFFKEFNNMRKPIPDEEFQRGKNLDALGYAANFETNEDIASALAELVLYKLPDNYFNTYIGKAMAVNRKSAEAVAKKHIDPANMIITIVGDRSKIEADVRKLNLGTVKVLSVEDVLGKKPQL